ncbi:hypothetical protein [Microcoleus sp. PH2017_22_RUC_O_B]|uniref:hypothetical protein n=1 Tax=Microcoleus sp. PH2017_22_RUC_O_B TaxID=2798833 RepID=UPI0025EC2E17|nr:hypothetical protein [Microcoleus sp. PH2017_22_RUC_O_B]
MIYEDNRLKRLYDSQGKLIRQQGNLFNSPLHFMGFSRGTVVNRAANLWLTETSR